MSFMSYMNEFFIEENRLALTFKISRSQLLRYIETGAIPNYSYHIINCNLVETTVFGKLKIDQGIPGKYYSKSVQHWFTKALKVIELYPTDQIGEQLQNEFQLEYSQHIKQLLQVKQLFPELFDDKGIFIESLLKKKAAQTCSEHLSGAYGVCVVNPNSVSAIIEKQIALRRLTSVTENGNKQKFSDQQQTEFLRAAERFDQVAMPFSPADYPHSSRRRLLDDIRARLDY